MEVNALAQMCLDAHVAVSAWEKRLDKRVITRAQVLQTRFSHERNVLHLVAMVGNTQVAAMLAAHFNALLEGKDAFGCTPLHLAAAAGQWETLQVLVGSHVGDTDALLTDELNVYGRSVLLEALLVDVEEARHLGRGIDWETTKDDQGNGPVHLCAARGHVDALEWLCEEDSRVLEQENGHGMLPLHISVAVQQRDMVLALLRQHRCVAHIGHRDHDGDTALHLASKVDDTQVLQLLLEHRNAPPLLFTRNKEGHTPIDLVTSSDTQDALKEWLMYSLQEMRLMGNQPEWFLKAIVRSQTIQLLDISRHTSYAPSLVLKMPALERLVAESCGLEELDVREADDTLRAILLAGNKLKRLDECGGSNVSLLDVSDNQVEELRCTRAHTSLSTLKCNRNALEELPMAQLGQLTHLECQENQLHSLHPLGDQLAVLQASHNNLQGIDLSGARALTHVDACHNAIESVRCVEDSGVMELLLSHNRISHLSVSSMRMLTQLDVRHNAIASLNVSTLLNLEVCMCSNNALHELVIAAEQPLRVLDASHNQLTDLPEHLCDLAALEEADLSFNSIRVDSMSTTQLKQHHGPPVRVSLAHNQVDHFPLRLLTLGSLTEVDLSHNPLSVVPKSVSRKVAKQLRVLRLDGCTNLVQPPQHVVRRNEGNAEAQTDDVLRYLNELSQGDTDVWPVFRVVLLGCSRQVGTSHLRTSLEHEWHGGLAGSFIGKMGKSKQYAAFAKESHVVDGVEEGTVYEIKAEHGSRVQVQAVECAAYVEQQPLVMDSLPRARGAIVLVARLHEQDPTMQAALTAIRCTLRGVRTYRRWTAPIVVALTHVDVVKKWTPNVESVLGAVQAEFADMNVQDVLLLESADAKALRTRVDALISEEHNRMPVPRYALNLLEFIHDEAHAALQDNAAPVQAFSELARMMDEEDEGRLMFAMRLLEDYGAVRLLGEAHPDMINVVMEPAYSRLVLTSVMHHEDVFEEARLSSTPRVGGLMVTDSSLADLVHEYSGQLVECPDTMVTDLLFGMECAVAMDAMVVLPCMGMPLEGDADDGDCVARCSTSIDLPWCTFHRLCNTLTTIGGYTLQSLEHVTLDYMRLAKADHAAVVRYAPADGQTASGTLSLAVAITESEQQPSNVLKHLQDQVDGFLARVGVDDCVW